MIVVKTLILAEKDVKRLLSMEEVFEAVELAFAEQGMNRTQIPPRVYLFYPKTTVRQVYAVGEYVHNGFKVLRLDYEAGMLYIERDQRVVVIDLSVHPNSFYLDNKIFDVCAWTPESVTLQHW